MDKEKRHKFIIQICCVLASFILWLYISNVQNPVVTRTIKKVPVTVEGLDTLAQHSFVATSDGSYDVDITVKGKTSDVNTLEKHEIRLEANLADYALKEGDNKIPIIIKQLPDNVTIVNSSQLWVNINLDALQSKNFPVKLNISGKVSDGYNVSDIVKSPDEVKVSGATSKLNQVKEVVADVNLEGVSEAKTVTAELNAVDSAGKVISGLDISPRTVSIQIPVNKVKTVPVKINTKNTVDSGLSLQSVKTSTYEVKITGEDSKLNEVNQIETEAVDLQGVNKSTSKDVKLVVPEGITVLGDIKTITVKIEVSKSVSKKSFKVPIVFNGLGENLDMTSNMTEVTVTLNGAESDLEKVDISKLLGAIDLSGKSEGEHTISISINVPSNLSLESQSTKEVRVTIKKKASEGTNDNSNH